MCIRRTVRVTIKGHWRTSQISKSLCNSIRIPREKLLSARTLYEYVFRFTVTFNFRSYCSRRKHITPEHTYMILVCLLEKIESIESVICSLLSSLSVYMKNIYYSIRVLRVSVTFGHKYLLSITHNTRRAVFCLDLKVW